MRNDAFGPADRQSYAEKIREMTRHLAPFIREAGEQIAQHVESGAPYVDTQNNALVIDGQKWVFDAGFESQVASKKDLDAAKAQVLELNRHVTRLKATLTDERAAHGRAVAQLQEQIKQLRGSREGRDAE